MSRLHAVVTHLAICSAVGTVLVGLFWFVWYPQPLFTAIGGRRLFILLLGVDVALGPLLTFVVFKTGKKTLKFDLALIGFVQVVALAYGVYTLLNGRPVYVASLGNHFAVVRANDVEEKELVVAKKSLPWLGPEWVGTKPATDKAERERVMFSGLAGASYGNFPQYHAPLKTMREEILKNTKSIAFLRKLNARQDSDITAWLLDHGQTDDSVIFQGLKARAEDMAVILDAKTAKVIGIAPFKPWD